MNTLKRTTTVVNGHALTGREQAMLATVSAHLALPGSANRWISLLEIFPPGPDNRRASLNRHVIRRLCQLGVLAVSGIAYVDEHVRHVGIPCRERVKQVQDETVARLLKGGDPCTA